MNRIKEKLPRTIVFLVIVSILVVVSLYKFNMELSKSIEESINNKVKEINKQNIERIKLKIRDKYDLMETMALFIGQSEDIFSKDIMDNLAKQSQKNSYIRMAVTASNGIGYTQFGQVLDISDREYFVKGMQGENSITEVMLSRIDNEESIILAVPIYRDSEIIGVLRSVYQLDEFTNLLEIEYIDKTGVSLIIQKDGTCVSRPDVLNGESNFFDFLRENKMFNNETINHFQECIASNEYCDLSNYNNENKGTLIYEEVGINDWYMVNIIKGEIYDKQLEKIFDISMKFIVEVLLIVIIFIIYLVYQINKGFNEIRINEERYRIISEQSNEILFEYDILKDSIYFSSKWEERFGYNSFEKDFRYKLEMGNFVSEEDKLILYNMFENLKSKHNFEELELQIINIKNNPIWCRVKANAVRNRRNVIVKIFGEIKDIHEDKNQKEHLIEAASRDSLTNLYNTGTVNKFVQDYLKTRKSEDKCAIIYIDLDNFKYVNDTYGHLNGDEVLKEVAITLLGIRKEGDIAGRIGGDEFFMLIKNVDLNKIDKIAESICSSIRNIKIAENADFIITASVGISICPKDGLNSLELYKNADRALYKAKEEGKNRYKLFETE